MQSHIERIKRYRAYTALPRRKAMYEPVLGKDVQPPAPQIAAYMPQYKTHSLILSLFVPQTPQRVQPSKQPTVALSVAARSYSCHR